jgi:hypothetical protein
MNEPTRKLTIAIAIRQSDGSYTTTFPMPVDAEKVGRAVGRRLIAAVETIEDFHGNVPVTTSSEVVA